jgi:DNA topoisomerase-1
VQKRINYLLPHLGLVVTDFLKHFEKVMDFGFTAKIEGEFDEIAAGNLKIVKCWKTFINPSMKPSIIH